MEPQGRKRTKNAIFQFFRRVPKSGQMRKNLVPGATWALGGCLGRPDGFFLGIRVFLENWRFVYTKPLFSESGGRRNGARGSQTAPRGSQRGSPGPFQGVPEGGQKVVRRCVCAKKRLFRKVAFGVHETITLRGPGWKRHRKRARKGAKKKDKNCYFFGFDGPRGVAGRGFEVIFWGSGARPLFFQMWCFVYTKPLLLAVQGRKNGGKTGCARERGRV